MANSSRSKTPGRVGQPQGSERMLYGVVALLFTAVICFGLGILVGKNQPSVTTAQAQSGNVERLPGASEAPRRETPRQVRESENEQGVRISPSPVVIPKNSSAVEPASRTVTQRIPAPPPRPKDTEKAPETRPEPSQAGPKTENVPAPAEVPSASAPATTNASAEPAAPSPLDDLREMELAKKEDEPLVTPATEDPATSTMPPAQLTDTGGSFTVQVASFDTMANAQKFKKAIESKSDYEITLYASKDGKVVKACIGSYPDKAAADKARAELGRINDFKGCFVKPVSEL